jgi:hypothetical protein
MKLTHNLTVAQRQNKKRHLKLWKPELPSLPQTLHPSNIEDTSGFEFKLAYWQNAS